MARATSHHCPFRRSSSFVNHRAPLPFQASLERTNRKCGPGCPHWGHVCRRSAVEHVTRVAIRDRAESGCQAPIPSNISWTKMINQTNYASKSIDDWQVDFHTVYGGVDSKRRPTEIWLMLVEDASQVAEAVRLGHYPEALKRLSHVTCWACSFASRLQDKSDLEVRTRNSIQKMIWYKYPNLCSTCAQPRCICSVRRAEIEEMTSEEKQRLKDSNQVALTTARSRRQEIPKSLDKLQDMFGFIYQGAHYSISLEAIAFHFMEEVGEVATCIRQLRTLNQTAKLKRLSPSQERKRVDNIEYWRQELEDEIADVMSWCFSLTAKLDYILGAGSMFLSDELHPRRRRGRSQSVGLRLSKTLWDEYRADDFDGLWCPQCKQRVCQCNVVPL